MQTYRQAKSTQADIKASNQDEDRHSSRQVGKRQTGRQVDNRQTDRQITITVSLISVVLTLTDTVTQIQFSEPLVYNTPTVTFKHCIVFAFAW